MKRPDQTTESISWSSGKPGRKTGNSAFHSAGGCDGICPVHGYQETLGGEQTCYWIPAGTWEATAGDLRQLYNQLEILYTPQAVRLDSLDVPLTIKTLVVIRPNDTIPPAQLARIEQFLSRGGRLLLALNRVEGNLQQSVGYAVNTGWEEWLQKYGITIEDAFVTDVRSGSVTVQQQTAFGILQTEMPFYYLPIAALFAKHPITTGLENVMFEFVSPLEVKTDSAIQYTPLVFSSERSNALKAPQYFDINRQWTEADFPEKNLVLAAAFEGVFSGDAPTRMVVIADGDFPLTTSQRRPRIISTLFRMLLTGYQMIPAWYRSEPKELLRGRWMNFRTGARQSSNMPISFCRCCWL